MLTSILSPQRQSIRCASVVHPIHRESDSSHDAKVLGPTLQGAFHEILCGILLDSSPRSIRVPAAFNGLYALCPSPGRVPYAGCVNTLEGQDSILSSLGPLSSSLGGIKAFLKSVASQKPWLKDPLATNKPWNEEEYQLADHGNGKRLCFAIMWHDEFILPQPPVTRALEATKQALLAAGHQGSHNLST